jgi:hypothetical protein
MLFVLLLLSEVRYYLSERRWAQERTSLYNRLQAGTLAEYASYRGVVEPVKPANPTGTDAGMTFAEIDRNSLENATAMDIDAVASAQNSYADMMG